MEIAEFINKNDLKGKEQLIAYLEKIEELDEKIFKIKEGFPSYDKDILLKNYLIPERNKIFNQMMREVINGNIELNIFDREYYNNNIKEYSKTTHYLVDIGYSVMDVYINLAIAGDITDSWQSVYQFNCPADALDEDIRENIGFKFSRMLLNIDKEIYLTELTKSILQTSEKFDKDIPYLKLYDLKLPHYENQLGPYGRLDCTLFKKEDGTYTAYTEVRKDTCSEFIPYIKFTDEQQKMLKNKFTKEILMDKINEEMKTLPASVSPDIEIKTPEETR